MTQIFFVWPHGGKSASVVGTFNHWNATPLSKQGNYFFTVLDLADGVYSYKFVVDGRWVYDISQPHEDDGSGNWNNYVEVGEKHAQKESAPKQEQHQKQQQGGKSEKQHQQQQQQPKKDQRQQKKEQQPQEKSEKQQQPQEKSEKQQQPQEKSEKQPQQQQEKGGKGKQQQQQQQSKKGGKQQQPEPEAAPEAEPEAQAETESESAPAPAPEAKKERAAPASIITLEVVGSDVDTDMSEVERFVRSIERPGLKWEGSQVKEHVFGLKKIEIICQAQDDVAMDDDIIVAIQANEELIGGASILNFAC
jgi:translation elongation factor EF-1beta